MPGNVSAPTPTCPKRNMASRRFNSISIPPRYANQARPHSTRMSFGTQEGAFDLPRNSSAPTADGALDLQKSLLFMRIARLHTQLRGDRTRSRKWDFATDLDNATIRVQSGKGTDSPPARVM